MYYLRLLYAFIRASVQQEVAFRFNFFVSLLFSLLNLGTGVLGLVVLFRQVQTVHGWTLSSSLVLLGVFQLLGALRGIVFAPSLERLTGIEGEVGSGRFDFILLRPVNVQFLASLRNWSLFAIIDIVLGGGVLGIGIVQMGKSLTWLHLLSFVIALSAGVSILYAILLFFTSLVFWNIGFFFTWVLNDVFQLARYPMGLYPAWLRLVLTWIIPVGLMTTIPTQAISGELSLGMLMACVVFALALLVGASLVFHKGLQKYTSASS
ncbi:MAG: ABC transporter permease [Ktedonobacteraceae bacterium]